MQNPVLKNLFTAIILLLAASASAQSYSLEKADSLFKQKRYTQSFDIYKSLFDNKFYTPAMLLKMAFVEEGLNHVANASFYLNLYYRVTQDDAVLTKLKDLAANHRLEGYEFSDGERLYVLYQKHHLLITVALASMIMLLMVAVFIKRLRYKSSAYVSWSLAMVISVMLLAHLHLGLRQSQAIIARKNTYLMDGPSAGASVIGIVSDGHKVVVKGKHDVWARVQWGNKEVYIKESNLLPISL